MSIFHQLQAEVNTLAAQYDVEVGMFNKCQITHADLMFTNRQYEAAVEALEDFEASVPVTTRHLDMALEPDYD